MLLWAFLVPAQAAPAAGKPVRKTTVSAKKKPAIKRVKTKPAARKKPAVRKPAVKRTAAKRGSAKLARKGTARKSRRRPAHPSAPVVKFVALPPVLEPLACSLSQTAPGESIPCINCAEQALSSAYTFTGLRYKRGGTSPETGFDCSGFVRHVFQNSCELDLPRTAREQYEIGLNVGREELKRGDLVFFRRGRANWHVGIYTGDGQFIHSPNRREAIKVSSLDARYYKKHYLGARRLTTDILPQETEQPLPPVEPLPVETEVAGGEN